MHFTEEVIKEKFIIAFNSIYDMREEIISNCKIAAAFLGDCSKIDAKLDEERLVKLRKADAFNDYIYVLKKADGKIDVFDDTVWTVSLDKAIVNNDKTITFVFRDGAKVSV